MKLIKLSRGLYATVDDLDFESLSNHKWHAKSCGKRFYAARTEWIDERNKVIYMHRQILNPSSDQKIDHANGDGLNNSRSNLRICSHSENLQNCFHARKNRKSRFKGLGWHRASKSWHVRIRENGIEKSVGYYKDEILAALSYNVAASFAFKQFARLNKV